MSIAENFEIIADAVYEKGIEKGKKDEYDKFWDGITNNNTRTNYEGAFRYWGIDYIRPPYVIQPTGRLVDMFRYSYGLKKVEAKYFDFSKIVFSETADAAGLYYTFAWSDSLEEIEDLGIPPCYLYSTFRECTSLKKIHLIRLNENCLFTTTAFQNCAELEYLRIEGTIGQKGFNVQWSTKLSSASIVSIIEALSTTTSGLTVTLSQTAVNSMVFPIVGNKGTYNSWTELEQSRTNWTISLL
jgi:hypothetical protein